MIDIQSFMWRTFVGCWSREEIQKAKAKTATV